MFYSHHNVIKWLSGVPAAISSITAFALITMLMGFIPQSENNSTGFLALIGLTHLKSSWPILLIQIHLLSSLGLVVLKRMYPFKGKNIGFLLNHLGLWITLVAALFGSGDLKRLTINLLEDGKPNNIAISQNTGAYKLPFELKLLNFHIDEYVPRIVLVNANTGKFLLEKGEAAIPIELGKTYKLKKWSVTIDKYLEDAILTDTTLSEKLTNGSFPAVFVTAKNTLDGRELKGWLGTGSFAYDPRFINLENDVILALTMPEVKKYRSDVVVTRDNEIVDTVSIEVNKPYNIAGWKVYQISYDENKGKWSTLSVLEVVSDPWLKIVFLGIFMMFGGSVYLFWIGRKKIN
jgi:hypothetical protein